MGKCSDKGDRTIEGMDTELPQQDNERAQDDMRISPKRPKKMKMEKTGEPQNESSRSRTRGQSTKTGRDDISPQQNNPSPTPPTVPISTIEIATLNINGITARTRVGMLADFIRRHDFDIIFTQEVTSTEVMNVRGYNAHLNIGASIRGTAILAKSTLHLTNIITLPSGRTIAADYKGI